MSKNVYVSIGNSDDKLTQHEWSRFVIDVNREVHRWSARVHGVWYSAPDSPYQNACWCFEILNNWTEEQHKKALSVLAGRYRQDSIAWAEAPVTFVEPSSDPDA